MIERHIAKEILENLSYFPVVGVIGPRQVGKTTLAKQLLSKIDRPSLYLDLELEEDQIRLQNAQSFLQSHADKCIVLDEIQLQPRLLSLMRALIDQNRTAARFMILGSASPALVRESAQTLAGRIAYSELTPLSLSEIENQNITRDEHWFRGGFPNALLAPNNRLASVWLHNFTTTFMEKDLKSLGYDISLVTMSKLYTMVAHIHGQLLNMSMLSNSLGVTQPTIKKYLELLEGGFLINRLQPYFLNIGKRLVKAPKIYYRDTGILHHLASIADFNALQGHPLVGASWEGYVLEQIKRVAGNMWQYYFYRTQVGAEVDLVLISPNGKMTCIEIKYALKPIISKGFYISIEDLKPHFQYVIVPSGDTFYLNDNIKVCSIQEFLKNELSLIS